jgi:hypothetical protein
MNFEVNGIKMKDLAKMSEKYDMIFERKEKVYVYL